MILKGLCVVNDWGKKELHIKNTKAEEKKKSFQLL